MADRPYNVLFLCTDKSARSTIAEALINQWGRGKFRGLSAGSHPKGTVHPRVMETSRRTCNKRLSANSTDPLIVPRTLA
jgi:arsenate reductase